MYDLIKTTTLCPGLVVTLVESPSLVFLLEPSACTLMFSLLKVRTKVIAKNARILERNDDNQRNYPKKYLSGEGEGLFHRAISHSGTMLMPIDVSILCPNFPDKLLNF